MYICLSLIIIIIIIIKIIIIIIIIIIIMDRWISIDPPLLFLSMRGLHLSMVERA